VSDHPPTESTTLSHAAFLKTALEKIRGNLDLLIGKPIVVSGGDATPASGAEVASRVPNPGVIYTLEASGNVDGRMFCLISGPLAITMASLAQMKSEAATEVRLGGAPELAPEELDGIKEIGSFIVAALGDFAKEATDGRIMLSPADARILPGGDPTLFEGDVPCLVMPADVAISTLPPASMSLVVSSALASAWVGPDPKGSSVFGAKPAAVATAAVEDAPALDKPAPPPRQPARESLRAEVASPRPVGTGPSALVWVSGSSSFAERVATALGAAYAVTTFTTLPEVLGAIDGRPAPAAIAIEIPGGAEFQLDVAAALRRHPALAGCGVLVALEAPSRRHVLRCGALGLVDVVPSDLDFAALGERLARVLKRPAAPK
jgi:hypothetical protein